MFSCKSKLSLINSSGLEICDVGTLEWIFLMKRLYKYLQSPFSFCRIFSNNSSSAYERESYLYFIMSFILKICLETNSLKNIGLLRTRI